MQLLEVCFAVSCVCVMADSFGQAGGAKRGQKRERRAYHAPWDTVASASVRVSNGVSGLEILPWTRISSVRVLSTLHVLLGSRPSRPVTLFHCGRVVDPHYSVPDGALIELTATIGDALSFEERDVLVLALTRMAHRASTIFQDFSHAARDDRALVLHAVGVDPDCLEFASLLLRNDRVIVLVAVCHSTGGRGALLEFASASLRNDRALVLAALANVDHGQSCLQYVSEELRMDKALVLFAMLNGGWLEFAPAFINDRDVVLAAVRCRGLSLQFASAACQDDIGIVLAAIQQNGLGLQFASESLRDDEEVVRAAVCHADDPHHVVRFASLRLQR